MWILLLIVAVLALSGAAIGNSFSLASLGNSKNSTNETGINVYSSDGSLTGAQITSDITTWPGSDNIWNICAAVAIAEGYNRGSGNAPYDLNNPGDVGPGDENGEQIAGGPQWHDGSSIVLFAVAEGGWRALYAKFQRIINGGSHVYKSTDTWEQVASKYAGNSANWLANVTSYLGVDPKSTPKQYAQG